MAAHRGRRVRVYFLVAGGLTAGAALPVAGAALPAPGAALAVSAGAGAGAAADLSFIVATYVYFLFLIWAITTGLSGLRSALMLIVPVAPWKFFVSWIASRIASRVSPLARPIA